ncbi:MAG: acetyl-CoA carboxylase biotin carboxyl carrier protein [Phycisphaeraceae bacterium]|nr:acetyl-CoA carboxylase biotin carboxyl carrier protein [Phycisphaeraceae bacterium]
MIDIRKLKELVKLMVENDLAELDLRDQEEKVTVKRGYAGAPIVQHVPMAAPMPRPLTPASADGEDAAADAQADDAGLIAIESPMVGTFYSSPNPDAEPFVKVGTAIDPGSTVCLVEAMKVFNEIKAETSGTIERVLAKSGQSVEFGQKLFLVRPA